MLKHRIRTNVHDLVEINRNFGQVERAIRDVENQTHVHPFAAITLSGVQTVAAGAVNTKIAWASFTYRLHASGITVSSGDITLPQGRVYLLFATVFAERNGAAGERTLISWSGGTGSAAVFALSQQLFPTFDATAGIGDSCLAMSWVNCRSAAQTVSTVVTTGATSSVDIDNVLSRAIIVGLDDNEEHS